MKKIVLSKLLKLEIVSFALEVIRIVSQYDVKELLIDGTYQALTNEIPNIKLLEVPYKNHHLTKRIAYYNKMCLRFAATINSQMSLHNHLIDKEKLEIVQIAYPLVKLHFDYLGRNNRPVIHRTIKSFFYHLKNNPEVKEALNQLGFGGYLEQLLSAHIEYEECLAERVFSKSQRPKIDSRAIQNVLERQLQLLFTQIDCYQRSFSDLDYKPLLSELNTLISGYVKNINMRAAFNKRKALEKKQAKEKEIMSAQEKVDVADMEQEGLKAEMKPESVDKKKNTNKKQDAKKKIDDNKQKGITPEKKTKGGISSELDEDNESLDKSKT